MAGAPDFALRGNPVTAQQNSSALCRLSTVSFVVVAGRIELGSVTAQTLA
jgi:hypothetical protein